MKFTYRLTFIFSLCIYVNCQKTFLDTAENIRLLRNLKLSALQFFEKTGEKERIRQAAEAEHKLQNFVDGHFSFPCNLTGTRSSEVPTSVHKLRPGDIDVIAALGDSLTAGSGALATKLYHFLTDNRGVAFLGGGEKTWREYLTLPNIFKEFNPKLFGYAKSDSMTFQESAQFNLGTLGAMSEDLPFMAESLVKLMKNDPRVDIKNHWKLITIMMGANDFCSDMCYLDKPSLTINYHAGNLTAALRIIRDNLPRTFVSLTPPPHMWTLIDVPGRMPYCKFILEFECPCFFGPMRNYQPRQKLFDIMTRVQLIEEEITNKPEFQRDDFAVVFQPFTVNLTFRSIDGGNAHITHFAPDCFHISQKANARAANAMWNILLEPLGRKTAGGWDDPFKNFNCPTSERPFIYTSRNSNKTDI